MAKFDSKSWNDKVFQKYMSKVPNVKENSLIKNGILRPVENLKAKLSDEVGGNYIVEPIKGLLNGQVQNYDGVESMTATSRDTFEQGKIIIGRMKSWTEKDFSTELTGENWLENVASEVKEYYDEVDQADILAILKGIFAMTDTASGFVANHSTSIEGNLDATSMNSALQKASGDKKKLFKVAFMHSAVATNLENLQLLSYLKYTDSEGIERDLTLATYNGKLVVIDDDMPTEEVEASGDTPAYTNYTTYVLGEGFFDYTNVGVKVPSEMNRDPALNGGVDTLYTRQRKMYVPKYISFTKAAMASNSPTIAELENGDNWVVVNNGKSGAAKKYINHKMIPLARVISRG